MAQPEPADLLSNLTLQQAFELGVQHHRAGRLADAEALYRQVLAAQPQHPDALHLLGLAAYQSGQAERGVQLISQAIALQPHLAAAHGNLGEALRALGRRDEAIASYRRAIELGHVHAGILNNLGSTLLEKGELGKAAAVLRQAIVLQPTFAEAHNNLGNVLWELGAWDDAIAAYRRAVECKPRYPEALNNLSTALRETGRVDEAIVAAQQALQLWPEFAAAHASLGSALRDAGETEAAIAAYRRSLVLRPNHPKTHSLLILALQYTPGVSAGDLAREGERWNEAFGRPAKRAVLPHSNPRDPERRLRVGYVSPDFRRHPLAWNLRPLFQQHDRDRFEILCYSGVGRADEFTDEYRRHAALWRDVRNLSDEALAETIRQDGVDILVDLSQHMADNRLPVFALQPAPVQVSFGGYPDSTGLEAIAYRISDRWLEGAADVGSPNPDLRDSERVYQLDSFWCFDPSDLTVAVNELPALAHGYVTFGSQSSLYKINEPLAESWARILAQVRDSRMLLLLPPGKQRERVLNIFARGGIESSRVEFADPRPREMCLELYRRMDLVLDTFPYSGHTTNMEALWMGLPVISRAGETRVSRGGYSILCNLGLAELVAKSAEEYEQIAVHWAGDLAGLTNLRRTLRARMENSVLMDAPRFARGIETAYRAMWRDWCEKAGSV